PAPEAEPQRAPAPAPVSELATMEVPVVTPEGPTGNVEELFARIRAGRADDEGEDSGPVPELAAAVAVDPVASENALETRDDLLENVEAGLTRALKRVLQDEQNEVLDRLRRVRQPSTAEVLPEQAVQLAAYREAALPWLQQAARAGVGFMSDPVPGSEAESHHPSLDGRANDLAAELVEPLRTRLARALDDGAGEGDPSVVAESLRSTYRQVKVSQVEAVARHHVVVAFSVGAYVATPQAARLQWVVEDDGHCPDCDDNALAGPTAKGQPFPTGQLHPPAHPGCRCLLVSVTA
ncbi:MAG TPA: hypothetical protein VHF91_06580, partial [Acidimicrobiales bacterium]|nr:hypothetical protein [Acidimicrobiales bacterium]